jgi:hypothetical protein
VELLRKQFRRVDARAKAMAPGERQALIERILPRRGEQGARVLSLVTERDREAAPVAILAAFDTGEITGAEADRLLQALDSPEARERYRTHAPDDPPAGTLSPWGEAAKRWREKHPECCDAASGGGALDNINEKASAGANGDASR